jgi:hypothetical protein
MPQPVDPSIQPSPGVTPGRQATPFPCLLCPPKGGTAWPTLVVEPEETPQQTPVPEVTPGADGAWWRKDQRLMELNAADLETVPQAP